MPLAPASQSIVSKYESNILYLNGVNMFTRFRGVLELRLCTDCLPLKEQHLSTLTSLFFSSHSSILSIIQLYCHGGRECSWFPNIHLDWILSTNKQLDLISIHISFPDFTRSTQVSIHWRFSHQIGSDQTKTIFNIWAEYRWTLSALKVCWC